MATGGTAPPMTLASSPPPHVLDQSPSNMSSPLSDVEDKDEEPDGVGLDILHQDSTLLGTPNLHDEDGDGSESRANSDGESKLSDMDVNDSEAETERLYDTPPKNGPRRNLVNGRKEIGGTPFIDRRGGTVEQSPSKLRQQILADAGAEDEGSDGELLSDADGLSIASSEAEHDQAGADESQRPSPAQGAQQAHGHETETAPAPSHENIVDSRKRKRSSAAETLEIDHQRRKRNGSIGPTGRKSADAEAIAGGDANSTTAPGGGRPAPGDSAGDRAGDRAEGRGAKSEASQLVKDAASEPVRLKRPQRSSSRKSRSPGNGSGTDERANGHAKENGQSAAAAQERVPAVDEEHGDADVDEEAELAQRNEEELERKRSAWEELTAIERQFASFRERLYEERLNQLNQEEAMLTADNPTHPEYLAMLRCIDERRDERIRVSKMERELNLGVLRRRAVAERAQMLTQYWQSVRASREKALEDLGREWYEIQHERRRCANAVPDYSIRFPSTRAQSVRQAVAYNKEVSILSGFAKYKGFPAAPPVAAATEDQLDEDFDSIKQSKEALAPPAEGQSLQAETAIGLPFRRSLGPAGEEFLEQTPWANPHHPSHQMQRQRHDQSPAAPLPGRHHAPHAGSLLHASTHSGPLANGNSPVPIHISHTSAAFEVVKSKIVSSGGLKRGAVLQVT